MSILFIANYDLFCGAFSYIFLGSILATFVPFTLGVDLIQLRYHSNPNYVMSSHKTSCSPVLSQKENAFLLVNEVMWMYVFTQQ